MESGEVKTSEEEGKPVMAQRRHLVSQVTSRIIGCTAAAIASIIMAFNRQTAVFGNMAMQADYKMISALKFFIGGNAVVSAYCLLSLAFVVAHQGKVGLMHVLDLMAMGLAMAAAAAATAVGYVGKYGNDSAGWMPVCGYFPGFCNRSGVAIVLSFIGFAGSFWFCVMQPIPKPWRGGGGGGGGRSTAANP